MAAKRFVKAVGKEIRYRRTQRKITQEKLAEGAGLHPNFIGLIERGQRNPSLAVLAEIAAALKLPLSELIAGAESRS